MSSTPEPASDAPPAETTTEVVKSGEPSLGVRFGATFVDGLIFCAIGAPLSDLGYLVIIALWLTRDALPFLDGQSIGKKLFKIQAVDEAGKPLTGRWKESALRNILLIILGLGHLVELIVLFTRQGKPEAGRRLGDDIAKTKVIHVP